MKIIKVWILFLNLLSVTVCTIDMSASDYEYIANNLNARECRLLVASLYFTSYELPNYLSSAVRRVPDDVTCVKLLLKWNSGKEKWEGRGKTHEVVERRLRQLGKSQLATWLGKTVYQRLAQDLNETLFNEKYLEDKTKKADCVKNYSYVDKQPKFVEDMWTVCDSVLWLVLVGLVGILLMTFFRIIYVVFIYKRREEADEVNLLTRV